VTVKAFLTDQVNALSGRYRVCLVLNLAKYDFLPGLNAEVEIVAAPIARNISALRDLHAVLFLITLFARRKFDAVHSVTPKAGLLAALAGALARVPVRVHTFTGQVWATRSGLARCVLKTADTALARMVTHILVDSPSQREFLVRERVVSVQKSTVLANGSICGVDTLRFRPDSESRKRIRLQVGIPEVAVVFLYVGRLKVDKGVLDLAQAFERLGTDYGQAWLLIVGPDEDGLRPRIERLCSSVASRLRFVGFATAPQEYMAAADVLCLPSYREGFGSVIIEAASVGIPAVASNIYGITDAIETGATGLLHTAGDATDLQSKMKQMVNDQESRTRMGANARLRAGRSFSKELVTSALLEFYSSVVGPIPQSDVIESASQQKKLEKRPAKSRRIKRLFDLIVAGFALIGLAPFLAVIAALVRFTLGGNPLFAQSRVEKNERVFVFFKFRTMTDVRDQAGELLSDEQRLTALGRFLRVTSLDELPQLWNVLKGDMSLVGPRPLLPEYLPRYTALQRRRHEVKPGITGWVQVNGRNSLTWEQKFELDVWYVDHQSLWLDVKILWLTVLQVLRRDGISQQGHATMPEFMGSPAQSKRDA
jgi:lipopolysaccharide/colanic/teichoic acid biosynthesis glycosyltransferase/glycosyltransferase involved in cell wall biosynthesis